MGMVRNIVKALLPQCIRQFLRTGYVEFVFARALRRFQNDPRGSLASGTKVIADLVYGWANKSWSASEDYLVSCSQHAMACHGPILECGSGLTTILVGLIAQKS